MRNRHLEARGKIEGIQGGSARQIAGKLMNLNQV